MRFPGGRGGLIPWINPRPSIDARRARRRSTGAPEALEGRSLPSGAGFTFTLYDPGHLLAPYPAVMPTIEAAGQVLNSLVSIEHPISVTVEADATIYGGDAAALGSPNDRNTGTMDGAYQVAQPAALYRALGEPIPYYDPSTLPPVPGQPPYGDITIYLNVSDLPILWSDPTGASRSDPVPALQADLLSVALHELMHGLGFAYLRNEPTNFLPPGQTRPVAFPGRIDGFAQDTAFGAGGDPSVLYFVGPTAEARYGGPVPLYSVPATDPTAISNYSHIGGVAGKPGAGLEDLMNPFNLSGTRYNVSDLDLAILADLGYQILSYPGLPPAVHYGAVTGSGPVTKVTSNGSPKGTLTATIQFTAPLDPASAADISSYSLNLPGKFVGKSHTYKAGKPLAIASAYYDASTYSVTLMLARPLPKGQWASLVVHGTSILDASGHPLVSDFNEIVLGVVAARKRGHPK